MRRSVNNTKRANSSIPKPMTNHENSTSTVAGAQHSTLDVLATRPALVRVGRSGRLSIEQRERLLDGLRSGQSLASVLRDNPDMPGSRAINTLKNSDEAFAKELAEAIADGVRANIDEALDYAYSVRGSKLAAGALKYADAVFKSAALQSPKEFGQLLKVADNDGNKLSIALVSYSDKAQPLEAHATTVSQVDNSQPGRSQVAIAGPTAEAETVTKDGSGYNS